jgi:SAM-dependent methyltransferase
VDVVYKLSKKSHWENFWETKKNSDAFYSNANRLISQIYKVTNVYNKKILEVGAGTGRDGLSLVKAGAKVFLLDYADTSLNLMKHDAKKDPEHVFLIKADALSLPFKKNSFDIVFHQGLLEHFRTPEPLLRENYRVLFPGGICLVDVPQKFHIYTVVKHLLIFLNIWFAGWETQFSIQDLGKLICNTGFQIKTFYGDWMQPSMFYRIIRELFIRIGFNLPMYPKKIILFSRLKANFFKLFRRFYFSFYTFLDIGVVAEKPQQSKP